MADHHKRFERWRNNLPQHTKHIVEQVLKRIGPSLEAHGYQWYPDYAGGDPKEIGANTIPYQRRDESDWPSIEITFDKRLRPWYTVNFAVLPPLCRKLTETGFRPVQQSNAIVSYAPAYFRLCKGKWNDHRDNEFGHDWIALMSHPLSLAAHAYFAISPHRFLDREVIENLSVLPVLTDLLKQGIPNAWLMHERGYVAKHVRLMGSWHLQDQIRSRAGV